MRLDVPESDALSRGNSGQGADLGMQRNPRPRERGLHLATAEAGKIGKPWMSSDGGAVLAGKRDRGSHDSRIAGVKIARHVRGREDRNQRRIVSDFVGAK